MIGQRLGHYEIVEKIGEGGMGAVYRARDTTLGREVALKLLPENFSGDGERIARLEREAHLLASLNHPNVATLYGLEESDGLKYLVMELVSGETLGDRIARGPLRIEECLGVLRQIAEGLEAAHEKGVIHRDLKPANVIVTSEDRVKVLDFGLAKTVTGEALSSELSKSPTLTREGTEQGVILGTASYMSPEQARGKTLDRRTDIWSYGCVLYEALVGRKAFTGETVSDILAAILEREPDWNAIPVRTPTKIRELLRRCLEKNPHRRLQHIGDARIEIEEAFVDPWVAPGVATGRKYLPWAVAAFLLGVAIWSLLRPRPEPERAVVRLNVSLPRGQAITDRNDPGVVLSPDGTRMVYDAGMLYVRRLDRFEAHPIAGTEQAGTPFFSPDGEWIGFFQDGKLKKVRLDGGLPSVICDAPDFWGASWGTDNAILMALGGSSGLSLVSALGGSPSVASTLDGSQEEIAHRYPEILPDGRSALFTIDTVNGTHRVGLLSLETGRHRALIDGGSFARFVPREHLAYVSEGALVAVPFDFERLAVAGEPRPVVEEVWFDAPSGTAHFSLSRNGTLAYIEPTEEERTLVWVDRVGATHPITETRRSFEGPRLSPDGERIAVSVNDGGKSHIWIYEMERGALMRVSSGPDDEAPVWTPDGKRLTFHRGIPANLFWQPADGSGAAERLTMSPYFQQPSSWTPDGKALVYLEFTGWSDTRDLWLLVLEAEPRERPLLDASFGERDGVVSPDGRFLAYLSDESGRFEVYVRRFPGPGGKWQVSNEGGSQPVWAHSGREIFYRNGDKMMAAAIEIEPAVRIGRPVVLFEGEFYRPEVEFTQYDVAPGDQRFMMIRGTQFFPTEIQVVENWLEELKRQVPAEK